MIHSVVGSDSVSSRSRSKSADERDDVRHRLRDDKAKKRAAAKLKVSSVPRKRRASPGGANKEASESEAVS
jgi:hypothetical protein